MPTVCIVRQCRTTYGSANNVHFHKLPSEPQRRAAWLRAINRDGPAGLGSESGFVCSDHFLPQDYETNLNVLRSLGFEKKKTLASSVTPFRRRTSSSTHHRKS
ncbi:hypothetical protein HPB51_018619 [Rhipicephalus microplus]|uniref:THAP-type domain-containing protein n=1 Tax=Rhipicephalus microplus TaxID=6941 RepID=A0A9J6F5F6_RHIMP|nr:hypothetical protein HPB51_018619 [Rhipicephalus microplus]